MSSKIEWTDETWNPVTGCTKISPGCANCYIERTPPMRMAGRKFVNGKIPIQLHEDRLTAPLRWSKQRMVFVNSMSDLFHEDVPDAFIDRVFAVIALCPQHTFQVLTKRSERMEAYLSADETWERIQECALDEFPEIVSDIWRRGKSDWSVSRDDDGHVDAYELDAPLSNVWAGVSVENRKHGLPRIEHLLRTPAAVRFLSVEPLLEGLGDGLARCLHLGRCKSRGGGNQEVGKFRCGGLEDHDGTHHALTQTGLPWSGIPQIDWVIVGGESGPGARPMHPDWIRSIRDQCLDAGVAFFFKQWGEWQNGSSRGGQNEIMLLDGRHGETPQTIGWSLAQPDSERRWHALAPTAISRVGKKAAGRLVDGREWNEMPKKQENRSDE